MNLFVPIAGMALSWFFLQQRPSSTGIEFLKTLESFRASAYLDPAGIKTIAYGHVIKPGETFSILTPGQGEALLREDLRPINKILNSNIKVPLTQNQIDALSAFIYNVGTTAFLNSTLLKHLNLGHYTQAANEFGRWIFITPPGKPKEESKILINRRRKERVLFLL